MKQKLTRTKYNRVLFSYDLHKSILGREGDCVRGGEITVKVLHHLTTH